MVSCHPRYHACGTCATCDAMKTVASDPLRALKTISNNFPDLWTGDICYIFIHRIRDGPKVDNESEDDPHWVSPLLGLLNILRGVQESPARTTFKYESVAMAATDSDTMNIVFNAVLKSQRALLAPGLEGDERRRAVGGYIGVLGTSINVSQLMKYPPIITLALFCWLKTPSSSIFREEAGGGIHSILTINLKSTEYPPASVWDGFIQAQPAEELFEAICDRLNDIENIGPILDRDLQTIIVIVQAKYSWGMSLATSGLMTALVEAADRQLQVEESSDKDKSAVMRSALVALSTLMMESWAPEVVKANVDLILLTRLLHVVSRKLVYETRSDLPGLEHTTIARTFLRLISRIIQYFSDTEELLTLFRGKLAEVYLFTRYQVLRNTETLQAWDQLASTVGLTEEKVLALWKEARQCCYPLCEKRHSRPEQQQMLRCARCESAFYHGAECQKRRHKKECRPRK
ncbi:hypothetical protein C8F01DRAFT_1155146 [Mycena amicta]|nr:hypothetical protein C8F01DRAFT_1155146 [Mycena amicta]